MSVVICDLIICKCNIEGICEGVSSNDCPKNNKISIYEKPELLREQAEQVLSKIRGK